MYEKPTPEQIADELRQIKEAGPPEPAESLDQLVARKRREQGIDVSREASECPA